MNKPRKKPSKKEFNSNSMPREIDAYNQALEEMDNWWKDRVEKVDIEKIIMDNSTVGEPFSIVLQNRDITNVIAITKQALKERR